MNNRRLNWLTSQGITPEQWGQMTGAERKASLAAGRGAGQLGLNNTAAGQWASENASGIAGLAGMGAGIAGGLFGDTIAGAGISGALSGVSAGAALGLPGMIAGGVIGLGAGIFGGSKAQQAQADAAKVEADNLAAVKRTNRQIQDQAALTTTATTGVTEPDLFSKQGGKVPSTIKPLKGGNFNQIAPGVYLAKGRPHSKGGIKGDTDRDGKADIEFEGGELYFQNMGNGGYIVSKDVSQKYARQLKRLGNTMIDQKSRERLIGQAVNENEMKRYKQGGDLYQDGGPIEGANTYELYSKMRTMGLYGKSYPDFLKEYSNPDARERLFNYMPKASLKTDLPEETKDYRSALRDFKSFNKYFFEDQPQGPVVGPPANSTVPVRKMQYGGTVNDPLIERTTRNVMNTFRPWPDGPVRYPLAPQTLPGPQAPWQRMSPLARDIYPFPNRAGSPASGIPAWQQAAQWQQMGPVPYAPATEGTYTRQQVSPKTGASAVMDVVANGPQAQGYGGVSMPPTYDVPGPFTGTGYNTSYDQPAGGSPAETTVTVGGGAGGRARVTTTPYAPSFSPRMRDRNTNLNASGNRITAVPKYQESLLNALTGAAGTLSGAAMSRGMRVDGTNDAGGNVDTSVSDAGVKPTSSFMDVLGQAALGITPFISDMVNARLTARTPNVPRPTLQRPVKLDTEIETGPAEAAIRAQNRSTNRALSAGIGDSARLVASQLMAGSQATKQLNDLHYNASMAETQLRNQEKGMNAEIAGQNVNRVNAFKNQQLMRELGIQGRKSETATSIGTKLQGMMRDKRLSETDRLGFEMIAKALNTYGTISRNFVDALKKRGGAYADIALELERKGLIDDGG